MMRYLFLTLLLFPALLFAGEETVPDLPSWAVIITTGITALIAWAFKLWRSRMKVDTEQHQLDATKSLMEQRNFIIDRRLIPFMESTATHYLSLRLPLILSQAVNKEFDWEDHYSHLKVYLRTRVLQKFAAENIDLLHVLGANELDNLIDRLLMRLITNLPASVQALLPSAVTSNLSKYATKFAVAQASRLIPTSED